MGRLFTTLTMLAIAASPLCGTALAQRTAPAVSSGGDIFLPPGKDPSACLKKADGLGWGEHLGWEELNLRACNYPSMTPCSDKDGDGVFKCATNDRMPLYEWWQVKGSESGDESYDFTVVRDNPKAQFPDYVVISEPCLYLPTYTLCKLQSSGDDQDCDDSVSTIHFADSIGNTAPIQSIVHVGRDLGYVKEALKNRNVSLTSPKFNPFDELVVMVKTSPCVTRLEAQVALTVGQQPAISLGTAHFVKNGSREKGVLSSELPNLFDFSSGRVTPTELDRYNTTNISLKLRRVLTAVMTSGGSGRASLSFTTVHGTVSVPIELDLCVPLYGKGDIQITTRRPLELETVVPATGGGARDPKPFIDPLINTIRPLQFGVAIYENLRAVDFLEKVRGQFAVVGDLSLIKEDSIGEPSTPGMCPRAGDIEVYESFKLKRAFVDLWARRIVMDPTLSAYARYMGDVALSTNKAYLNVFRHEFGHALGGLRDEYDRTQEFAQMSTFKRTLVKWFVFPIKNCSEAENVGVNFPPPQNVPSPNRASCTTEGIYRSTVDSVMRGAWEQANFNVVSCAWILSEALGGDAKSYFTLCDKYDTVKK